MNSLRNAASMPFDQLATSLARSAFPHMNEEDQAGIARRLETSLRLLMPPSMMRDISDFHTKFKLDYDGPPRPLEPELASFRTLFMIEEYNEYVDETECGNLVGQLDALVDLVYVAMGTAYLHGFDFEEAWRRVHEANMKKIRAQREGDSKRGSTFDVVKPEGWKPPDLSDLV